MPLDVVADVGRCHPALGLAHPAYRLVVELSLTDALPSRRLVPAAPFLTVPLAVVGLALLPAVT